MPYPTGVLLCRPTYFDVIDVKNPFMADQEPVDRAAALRQWLAVRSAFADCGMSVHELAARRHLEDMVFTANPAFAGLNRRGERVAVAGRMRHPSRKPEVEPSVRRLADLGYSVDLKIPPSIVFEGGGDAVWHPGEHRIYGGYGWRSHSSAYPFLERAFGAEVIPLRLVDERFYHLDTALCAVDSRTALVVPHAFDAAGYEVLERHFRRLIPIDEHEALSMAANAAAAGGNVVIDVAAKKTIARLRALGYNVVSVNTAEFRKSGGSVYCMKQYLF